MFESIVFTLVMAAPAPTGDAATDAAPPPPEGAVIRAAVAEASLAAEKGAREQDQEIAKAHEDQQVEKARAELAGLKATNAEAERAEQAARAKKAADELSIERSAKLLEVGLTVGAGLAIQAPINAGATQQQTVGVTAMSYVMVLPAFWGAGAPTRKYCASEWAGKSAADASRAADALAFESAGLRVEALLETVRLSPEVTLDRLRATRNAVLHDLTLGQLNAAKAIIALDNATAAPDKAKRQRLLKSLQTDAMRTLAGWTPGIKPRGCWARKIGAWVGRPAKYKARLAGNPFGVEFDAKSDVDPVVAFGLGYTPNAYTSVLFGATYATTSLQSDPMDAGSRNDTSVWTATIGLGLNADILTLLSIN